ncbi:MAG TPA: sigma-70 family RNA polymerase sigma factor [Steroidobacteraceae bacterium]|nr:sigma-70 family RNA polymerase sigma factor [Steroidobacteraceae bacterium]
MSLEDTPKSASAFADRRLVERLLKGENAAFNEFFSQNFGRLYRFASVRIRDEAAAHDVVQETLCRALRKIRSFRGEAALFTWLCQICRSQLSEYFERHGKDFKRFVPIEDDPEIQSILDAMSAPNSDPAEVSRRNEVLRFVQVVLDHLPPNYGNALEWKYVEGASVEDIAARLGMQHAAAQSLLQRARLAFREMFEELYGSANVLQTFNADTALTSR